MSQIRKPPVFPVWMVCFKMTNCDLFLPFTFSHLIGCVNCGGLSVALNALWALPGAGLAGTFGWRSCASGNLHVGVARQGFVPGLALACSLLLSVPAPSLPFLPIGSSPACSDPHHCTPCTHRTDPHHCPLQRIGWTLTITAAIPCSAWDCLCCYWAPYGTTPATAVSTASELRSCSFIFLFCLDPRHKRGSTHWVCVPLLPVVCYPIVPAQALPCSESADHMAAAVLKTGWYCFLSFHLPFSNHVQLSLYHPI